MRNKCLTTQNRALHRCNARATSLSRRTVCLRKRLRGEQGQALVEFAIALPVLMLIIMGILTFGRYLNYSSQETRLASQAARWASVNVDPGTSIQAFVQAQASGELGGTGGTAATSTSTDVPSPVHVYLYYPNGSSGVAGTGSVRACITATVHFVPIIGNFVPDVQIVQTATARLEQTATAPSGTSGWTPDTPPSQCPLG